MVKGPDYIELVAPVFLETLSWDGGETECRGLFLARIADDRYVAVNNKLGQRWREEFQSKTTACQWLRGHLCLNIDNILCNGLTGERIPDVAERVRKEIGREQYGW